MTKEQFKEYNGLFYCEKCNHILPRRKVESRIRSIHKDGRLSHCNVCDWIDRHGGVPKIDGLSENQVVDLLHYYLNDEDPTINHISDLFNISLDEAIKIYDAIGISKVKISIKCNCFQCGKEIVVPPSVYKKNQNVFCSTNCYYAFMNEHILKGEESPFYERVDTTCTNCGKPIKIPLNKYNERNRYGESHNFCCQECYGEFRSKYYVGEKSSMLNYKFTKEQRQKMARNCLINSRKSSRFNSAIQLRVNEFLEELDYNYIREYLVDYYAIDNYLQDYNLMIEVMGDYWHASPLRYNDDNYRINDIQQNGIKKDKQKKSYIQNNYNINILYLWEYDVNNRPDLCKELIVKYVKSQGDIENYNSFNWTLNNGIITINDTIIQSYQEQNIEEYRHLFIS